MSENAAGCGDVLMCLTTAGEVPTERNVFPLA